MTETTDIAALREAAKLIAHGYKQRWGFETNDDTGFVDVGTLDHDGNLCPFIEVSISNWSDEDGDDERLAEFLTLANPVAILAILDKLEAERQRCAEITEQYVDRTTALSFATQRAEAAEARVGVLEGIIARKEFDALKGDRVPVAVVELNDNLTVAEIRGDIPRRKAVRELYDGALVVGQELFTAQRCNT